MRATDQHGRGANMGLGSGIVHRTTRARLARLVSKLSGLFLSPPRHVRPARADEVGNGSNVTNEVPSNGRFRSFGRVTRDGPRAHTLQTVAEKF
jgi:hypothetical protein